MVRVFFKVFFTATAMIFCCFSVPSLADGGVLKDPLKQDIQQKFREKQIADGSDLRAWLNRATLEATVTAREIKAAETLLRANSAVVSAELSSEIIQGLAPDLEKILASASQKGWKETLSAIQSKVEEKNLSLPDLEKNSKLILEFVQKIAIAEKTFWEEKAKADLLPKTEVSVELTPSGTLGQGLRVVGVLVALVPGNTLKESLKVSEQPTLLKSFLELNLETPKTN